MIGLVIELTDKESEPCSEIPKWLDSTVIPANSVLQMSVAFTLPDSNAYEGNIYIHNSSSDDVITVSVRGKGREVGT